MIHVTFVIPGEPMGKQRPRHGKGFTYTPTKTVNYETLVKMEYHNQIGEMFEGEIEAHITAIFSIPKSASKKKVIEMFENIVKPTKKPDADNIAKIVLDSLNGIAYKDDSQVVRLIVNKIYGSEPMVRVTLKSREVNE